MLVKHHKIHVGASFHVLVNSVYCTKIQLKNKLKQKSLNIFLTC